MGACGLVGVSFPVDIVLSAESGVVGLGEADIAGPLVLAFLARWYLGGRRILVPGPFAGILLCHGKLKTTGGERVRWM